MPGTVWSAPLPSLGTTSLTTASFTTATLTDISPYQCLVPPGSLVLGTRVRLKATGSYTASTAASTIAFGFYMNNAGTVIGTTPAILALSTPTTIAAITGGIWIAQYYGHMAAVSGPGTSGAASIVGRGTVTVGTSLTAASTVWPMPVTLALASVAQTATGLITYGEQNIMVGATVTTNTGLTNIITDELTCELLG